LRSTDETANLVRLTRMGAVNAYLVREDDGLTLVDTMFSGSAGAIIDAAAETGVPVVRIVATHAHSDHVGSLEALAARLPDAE
jgi:glyoxylase-like metal-dependent hydrolase (beta-lactamase superfamily II)